MPSPRSGRERAYEYLRTSVLTDPGLVGTFINEQDIAARVGVSRTPVREALLRLAAEDLVQLQPNRGAFIAPVSTEQTRQILQARGVIETWAARHCIASGTVPLAAMAARLSEQEELLLDGPDDEFARVDSEFHVLLVRAAGNPLLDRMYDALHARHVLLGLTAARRHGLQHATVVHEHHTVVAALRSGDADAAEQAIWAHLAQTERALSGASGPAAGVGRPPAGVGG
jgi:DNA-binding GntR family transcriptional regulator